MSLILGLLSHTDQCEISTMTTYVLIPGAGGEAWSWHRLVPALERRGHTAIPVDLPAGDKDSGWAEYADAVAAAASGRGPVTLVAASMGGFTAPLLAGRLPVERIVLLNAMIPAPGETGGTWWDNVGQRAARRAADLRAGRDPDAEFDTLTGFFHDVPEDVTAEAIRRGEPAQSDTPFAQVWPLDAWPDVPTRVISARDDRIFPLDLQIRVARDRLGITPEELPGGHLVALSRPEELATLLTGQA
jgi:pimeloyl-ACP methyl ester carboxylesterase